MSLPAVLRARLAVAVASVCMTAVGQQTPSFPGKVQKVGGTGIPHATVRIEGAGSTETSDSGEFAFPLSGNLKVGFPVVFHVANWVILKPCELKNGRTYLRDPAMEPIDIFVLPPRDPRLKSAFIGCLIEEEAAQLAPKRRSSTGPRSSLRKERISPFSNADQPQSVQGGNSNSRSALHSGLVEVAYHPHATQNPSRSTSQKSNDAADSDRNEFLAKKAKELGFSAEELKSDIEAWTKSIEDPYQKGLAALYDGQYAQASRYISESLNTPRGNVLTHYVLLGNAEYWQGHYPAAEFAFRKVLAVHSNDPIVLNNLAMVLDAQARYSEAEALYEHALVIDEKTEGPEHPDVAANLNNLAMLYEHQGKYSEAEPLYKRALAIDEKALGPDHPNAAFGLNNLATLYEHQDKYSEAEPLYKRALTIEEKALGLEHPAFATDLSNLGGLYYEQGKYSEAELLYKRAFAIDEKKLGPEHPNIAADLKNLAELYGEQRKYSEAELLFKRALAIDEKTLGPEHPEFAIDLSSLGGLYYRQGKYSEAEPLYKRALAIDEKALRPEHPNIAADLGNLAMLYFRQGKYGEAEPLYKRALTIGEKALGPENPDVAQIATYLASTLRKLGRDTEAKVYEKQAANIREKRKQ